MTNSDLPGNPESNGPTHIYDSLMAFMDMDSLSHADSEAARKEKANLIDAEHHEADAAQELFSIVERAETEAIPAEVIDHAQEIFVDAQDEVRYYQNRNPQAP